jgi:hypothetical protein
MEHLEREDDVGNVQEHAIGKAHTVPQSKTKLFAFALAIALAIVIRKIRPRLGDGWLDLLGVGVEPHEAGVKLIRDAMSDVIDSQQPIPRLWLGTNGHPQHFAGWIGVVPIRSWIRGRAPAHPNPQQ